MQLIDPPRGCSISLRFVALVTVSLAGAGPSLAQPVAKVPALPSETPAKYTPATDGFDYTRREAMIAMRDGVKLFTVILVPKAAKRAPILLTRTPYNAAEMTAHTHSSHLAPMLQGYDSATDVIVDGGYIRVAPVTAFETGTNPWRKLPAWPSCGAGCMIKPTPL